MGARDGIYHDVAGAPFKIGDVVRVVSFSDDTADEDLLGCQGSVLYFEYTCGCGQSFPKDPMIGVLFAGRTAEFWREELALVRDDRRRMPRRKPGRGERVFGGLSK
jgi:hypothetical protein